MKYIAISLNYTSLKIPSLVEIALIADDLSKDISELNIYHRYIKRDKYTFDDESSILYLNETIKKIRDDENCISESLLVTDIKQYLTSNGYSYDLSKIPPKIVMTVAGKNFNHYDRNQLESIEGWEENFIVRSRILDPSILYATKDDSLLPSLPVCVHRMNKERNNNTRQLELNTCAKQAQYLVQLLRHKFNTNDS